MHNLLLRFDPLRHLLIYNHLEWIHNQILNIEHLVKWANSTIEQSRTDYARLLTRNEMFAKLMKPKKQREAFVQHLEGFQK